MSTNCLKRLVITTRIYKAKKRQVDKRPSTLQVHGMAGDKSFHQKIVRKCRMGTAIEWKGTNNYWELWRNTFRIARDCDVKG